MRRHTASAVRGRRVPHHAGAHRLGGAAAVPPPVPRRQADAHGHDAPVQPHVPRDGAGVPLGAEPQRAVPRVQDRAEAAAGHRAAPEGMALLDGRARQAAADAGQGRGGAEQPPGGCAASGDRLTARAVHIDRGRGWSVAAGVEPEDPVCAAGGLDDLCGPGRGPATDPVHPRHRHTARAVHGPVQAAAVELVQGGVQLPGQQLHSQRRRARIPPHAPVRFGGAVCHADRRCFRAAREVSYDCAGGLMVN